MWFYMYAAKAGVVMFLVIPSVILLFCEQDNSQTWKQTSTKHGRHGQGLTFYKSFTFGVDLDLRVDSRSLFQFLHHYYYYYY